MGLRDEMNPGQSQWATALRRGSRGYIKTYINRLSGSSDESDETEKGG
jgi:hypothetical protein